MAKRSRMLKYGLPLAAIVAASGAAYSIVHNRPRHVAAEPVVPPPSQPLPAQDLAPTLSVGYIGATGLVEPQGQVIEIGTHVSGVVERVMVEAADTVKAGEPLFAIDRRAAEATLDLRRADLVAAERRRDQTIARMKSLEAQLAATRATIAALTAELDDLADQVRSAEDLKSRGSSAITRREVTRRENAQRAAEGRLAEARARAEQIEAEIALIRAPDGASLAVDVASVEQARQAVRRAEVDLDLLTVRAPISGTVLQVNVRPGEFAFAGALATPLVVLGRPEPLHVRVDIDEADVGRYRSSARAFASLRGQADVRIPLTFVRIEPYVVPKRSLSGATGERVDTRVLRVIYALPADAKHAYPGQQVDVFIESAPPGSARLSEVDR
jgi:HlyD family secretion protein